MNDLGLWMTWCVVRGTAAVGLGMLLYALARRQGPSARASVALATLLTLAGVSALSLSPWPRWWQPDGSAALDAAFPPKPESKAPVATNKDHWPAEVERPTSTPGVTPAGGGEWAAAFASTFREALRRPPAQDTRWRWPAWVGVGILAALSAGLLRLLMGLWAVRGCRSRCIRVEDASMLDLVAVLRAEMGCRRPVEVLQSPDIPTPATVGWRRPAVLLPDDWRIWTEDERRVVLAHELAHVTRNDYAAGVCAQACLAMHFYHPLAHWLAGRLRLQQELAADAWGARLSGGVQPYLSALAGFALRQDSRPAGWPARAFLPSRGTFLRRIEMLRDRKDLRPSTPPRGARAVTFGTLALAGVFLAGIRGPSDSLAPRATAAQAGDGEKAKGGEASRPFNLAFVPSDARIVLAARPSKALGRPELKPVADLVNTNPILRKLGMKAEDFEEIVVSMGGADRAEVGGRRPPFDQPPGIMFRAKAPLDLKKLDPILGDGEPTVEARHAGQTYHRMPRSPAKMAYFSPDDRTLVVDVEASLQRLLAREKGQEPPLASSKSWKAVSGGDVALAVEAGLLREVAESDPRGPGAVNPLALFAPLWEETRLLVAGLSDSDGLTLEMLASCGSEEGSEKVARTVEALLTLGRNALGEFRRAGDKAPEARPIRLLADLGDPYLKAAKVDRDGTSVRVVSQTKMSLADTVKVLAPVFEASRAGARRAQSVNNLKQLALAAHNYEAVNGHFPPAVVLGKDGKTPHSWRVALLPYIEQAELYNEYRFDEPWDGPHNKKLLDRMPALYAVPGSGAEPTHAGYFTLTGKATLFPEGNGVKISEITDGTSNTIMFVEARREIPWTKPEDIPFDPEKALPELGGHIEGGFEAALADGSVRVIGSGIEENLLKALITRAGGEVIDSSQIPGPGAPRPPANRPIPRTIPPATRR